MGYVKGGVHHHTCVYVMDSYPVAAVIRGYHVYRNIWNGAIGQILLCQWEPGNIHDPYAVSVVNVEIIVGQVPRAISLVCYSFLWRNCTLTCQVIGTKQYSAHLPQGGLEIPCKLTFSNEANLIARVKILLKEALDSGLLKPCKPESELQEKKTKVEEPENDFVVFPW